MLNGVRLRRVPAKQAYLEMPRMEKQKQGQAESHSSYLSLFPFPASRNRRLRKFC